MLNLKKLISEYGIYKIYEILFFAISAFTCLKQIEEKNPKKLRHPMHTQDTPQTNKVLVKCSIY